MELTLRLKAHENNKGSRWFCHGKCAFPVMGFCEDDFRRVFPDVGKIVFISIGADEEEPVTIDGLNVRFRGHTHRVSYEVAKLLYRIKRRDGRDALRVTFSY